MRPTLRRFRWRRRNALGMARWQSGDAADCKSVYVGSIPARASIPGKQARPIGTIGPAPPSGAFSAFSAGQGSVRRPPDAAGAPGRRATAPLLFPSRPDSILPVAPRSLPRSLPRFPRRVMGAESDCGPAERCGPAEPRPRPGRWAVGLPRRSSHHRGRLAAPGRPRRRSATAPGRNHGLADVTVNTGDFIQDAKS